MFGSFEEFQPDSPAARLLGDRALGDSILSGASCSSVEIHEISSSGTGTILIMEGEREESREVSIATSWSSCK